MLTANTIIGAYLVQAPFKLQYSAILLQNVIRQNVLNLFWIISFFGMLYWL